MKKRFIKKSTERLIEIGATEPGLKGWLIVIGLIFLAITLCVFKFLKTYFLKALDLIVTLTFAFLIVYLLLHPFINATISISVK